MLVSAQLGILSPVPAARNDLSLPESQNSATFP